MFVRRSKYDALMRDFLELQTSSLEALAAFNEFKRAHEEYVEATRHLVKRPTPPKQPPATVLKFPKVIK